MALDKPFTPSEQHQICVLSDAAKGWSINLWRTVAESLFNNSSEGVCITDADAKIIEVSQTLCRITGYSKTDLLGNTPQVFHSDLQDLAYYQRMWESLLETGHWSGELWNRKPNGNLYAIRLNIAAVCNESSQVTNYVGVMADITAAKLHLQELERTADHDALTGLPNRSLLTDRLQQAMAHSVRTNLFLAVCFLDLDGFKSINDSYGHAVGDDVLREIATRLKNSVRIGDTVSRIGGDEFVLLLWGLEKIDECKTTIDRVIGEVARPLLPNNNVTTLSASIGVAIYPSDGADQCELLAHADRAMYHSKQVGGNRYTFWSHD